MEQARAADQGRPVPIPQPTDHSVMSATIDTWISRLGFIAGACAVAAWLALVGTPGTAAAPAASIRLGALVNGELELTLRPDAADRALVPLDELATTIAKPVLDGDGLRAGGPGERGTLRVRNQTPRALSFAIRTTSSSPELDRSAWIEVLDGDRPLLRTTLERSHAWSSQRLTLASGEARTLDLRIWIPEGAPAGWQAARGDASLVFSSTDGRTR